MRFASSSLARLASLAASIVSVINEHSEARGLFHGRRRDDERHRRLRQRKGVEVETEKVTRKYHADSS